MTPNPLMLGIQIIPAMPSGEVLETIRAAETLGYDYCLVCDEGFMPDPYVVLGSAAQLTNRIRLGPVTNGYTRHPAVTASSLATLNQLSGGRAMAVLVAGGSMVLRPMAIPRQEPYTVVKETIEIIRRLLTGEVVSYQGKHYQLDGAQIHMGCQDIPIWLAARGSKLLELAGEQADGVVLMVKSDLAQAIEIVAKGSAARRRKPQKIYLDRIAYTPEAIAQASVIYTFVLMDLSARQLESLGITNEMMTRIRTVMKEEGPESAARLVSLDMIQRFQIAGTPEECRQAVHQIFDSSPLDGFLLNIVSSGLKENVHLMEDVRTMIS